jgi:hypothetical protein
VVPIHVDGSGAIFGKGAKRLKPGRTRITFGAPLVMSADENVRRFGDRIEQAVATLGDEALSDWWSARQRAAAGATPTLGGPAFTVGGVRGLWPISGHGQAGQRRRQKRGWPRLTRVSCGTARGRDQRSTGGRAGLHPEKVFFLTK